MSDRVAIVTVAEHVKHADDNTAVCLVLRNSYMTIAEARELSLDLARAADRAELKLPE